MRVKRGPGRAPHGVGHIRDLLSRAAAVLTATLVILVLSPALPAHSQDVDLPAADLPVALVADSITVESETGRVIAEGSVEVYYGQRTLTADRIVYDDKTGRISASGPLTLRDASGTTVFAEGGKWVTSRLKNQSIRNLSDHTSAESLGRKESPTHQRKMTAG